MRSPCPKHVYGLTLHEACKLHYLQADASIMSMLSSADVLVFTEMGTVPNVHRPMPPPIIPGFTCMQCVPRPQELKCGGVACYAQTGLGILLDDGIVWMSFRPPDRAPLASAGC
jgi:hypothetical protein